MTRGRWPLAALLALPLPARADGTPVRTRAYPTAPRSAQVDVYHGVEIADPFRPLEDPDSAATQAWLDQQAALTDAFLEGPERQRIRRRIERLWRRERTDVPFEEGGRLFFERNDGLQDQDVLFVMDSPTAPPRVLLDANALSSDGTTSVRANSVSRDGRLLASCLSVAGSDWVEVRVRDVETGRELPDVLRWVKFSTPTWSADSSGFWYGRYEAPREGSELQDVNRNQVLCFHRLGEPQERDTVVMARPDHPEWGFGVELTRDGQWLVMETWRGSAPETSLSVRPAADHDAPFVDVAPDFEAAWHLVGNEGSTLFFRTDLGAPRGRVVAVDALRPQREHWREIVPEGQDALEQASRVGDRIVGRYLHDAQTKVVVFRLNGAQDHVLELPGLGAAHGFRGRPDSNETFYSFTSFAAPESVWRYDVATRRSEPFARSTADVKSQDFVTDQVFYPSKDGARIPMFLVRRKDARPDGKRPVLLYGYGGFNSPTTPKFSPEYIAWMERGGVVAIANLRGGGEYGRAWHDAGRLRNKQNTFDDFIAAAEWLVREGWTTPTRLAISGRSNGGLLVGACMTQRPELFGAAVPAVGVMDMLRFQRFTIGWAWVSDYGSSDDPEMFPVLRAYSPLHALRPGTCYPPTLVQTSDHDDRVVPGHSFKFAAALQEAQGCDAPVLLRVERRAGHGSGTPTRVLIDEAADRLTFLAKVLDVDAPTRAPARRKPGRT